MKSIDIKPLKNLNIDKIITKSNLFTILNGVFVLIDNTINKYKDIFLRNCMHENIFYC